MSKDSQRVEKWKRVASEGLNGYHRQLLEKIVDEGVNHKHQLLEDLPTELKCEGKHCKLACEFMVGEEFPYVIKYVDVDTNEAVIEQGAKSWDDAIFYMMWRGLNHKDVLDMDGKRLTLVSLGAGHNKEEFIIVEKRYKVKGVKWRSFHQCPYCDSINVKSEHFRSSPESWMALAGREGDKYHCEDCGYEWENITCMS